MELIQYPANKGIMFKELKRAFDAYDNQQISNEEIKSIVLQYNNDFPNTLVKGNPEIVEFDLAESGFLATSNCIVKLGKNRANRVERILNDCIKAYSI